MSYSPTPSNPGTDRELYYWIFQELQLVSTEFGTISGVGGNVPAGGSTGQVLAKNSNADGDTAWVSLSVSWSSISGKPATFPPETHNHAIAQVTGLQTALDAKAGIGHTHTKAGITDFDDADYATAAQGLAAAEAYSWGDHATVGYLTSVSWGDVSGKPATFTPSAHNHTIAEITDLSASQLVPAGGTDGQVLTRESGNAVWADPQGGTGVDESVGFHGICGGIAAGFNALLQIIQGGSASIEGQTNFRGGLADTLFLVTPQGFSGGTA